ncbi:VOC family protein [Actinopolyspora erythraea]|uniref:VOC family protein n=1 Tax=Actinopolyspora erythraea TaxID=414996 RepID=A0A223RWT5_9ACTN|nr:VOC family protein [Actinopolyspora erythraea]ASU80346.1 VOC family protein [Actinopolyspora erythraea]
MAGTERAASAPWRLVSFVLDCPEPRGLAEFYAELLGWPIDESESDERWVELADPEGGARISCQLDPHHTAPGWPDSPPPQQGHLDIRVPDIEAAEAHALRAGAIRLPQPADELESKFRVYADPAGHPFCLCWGPPPEWRPSQ